MEKIRRVAFTTTNGVVEGVDFFVNPAEDKREILKLLRKEIGSQKSMEISSFSDEELGKALSAFNIPYKGTCLECVFQAAKVFEKGGPYLEWLSMPPKEVKKDIAKINTVLTERKLAEAKK